MVAISGRLVSLMVHLLVSTKILLVLLVHPRHSRTGFYFEYADGEIFFLARMITDDTMTITDLDHYYWKVAKAFDDIPDTTGVITADEFRRESKKIES